MSRSMLDRLRGQLPDVALPKLGRDAEIPVYMVHNSADAEDYFFIFDFEQFVERSRQGVFVRPKLKVWAGRDDFERRLFARQFREAFSKEFDAARRQLADEAGKGQGTGWFSWNQGAELLSGFVGNVVLWVAVSAGRMVLSALPLPAWVSGVRGRSEEEKLEASIDETKSKVDTALAAMEVTLHIELYRHAWRGQPPGKLTGLEQDAWPLPEEVRAHLEDKVSSSWW